MHIAWIVPVREQCGICLYAEKYVAALSRYATIVRCYPLEFAQNKDSFLKRIASCDIAHIQYEPSFFFADGRDFYPRLCRAIQCKKVVTLHEVYKTIPGVFPRDAITGALAVPRRLQWDLRHPQWAAFTRHASMNFSCERILVHAHFHASILTKKGVDASKIRVLPVPLKIPAKPGAPAVTTGGPVTLGATGFINPLYDYDLLAAVLERLDFPWRFVWIGGLRRQEDAPLLQSLREHIARRGWTDRFTVTGLTFREERDRLFEDVQIFCAFFRDRSSSESLADAIAARKTIVTTRIPLTEELVGQEPLAVLVNRDPDAIASRMRELVADEPLRRSLQHGCTSYCERFSYAECARRLMTLYSEVLSL